MLIHFKGPENCRIERCKARVWPSSHAQLPCLYPRQLQSTSCSWRPYSTQHPCTQVLCRVRSNSSLRVSAPCRVLCPFFTLGFPLHKPPRLSFKSPQKVLHFRVGNHHFRVYRLIKVLFGLGWSVVWDNVVSCWLYPSQGHAQTGIQGQFLWLG